MAKMVSRLILPRADLLILFLLLAVSSSAGVAGFAIAPSTKPALVPTILRQSQPYNGRDTRILPVHIHIGLRYLHLKSKSGCSSPFFVAKDDGDAVDYPAEDGDEQDRFFDAQTTIAFIGGQLSLVLIAAALAAFATKTPNLGLGPGISWTFSSLEAGTLLALPLGLVAAGLDAIEDRYPALQDVTKATLQSVLTLLGGKFKPVLAFGVALALGLAAGVGEEMLFRGIVQYELAGSLGPIAAVAVASIVFGAVHAVTPLYAALASCASVYFGLVYLATGNLAVPIACHAAYDVGALYYAHWTVSRLSDKEQIALSRWSRPTGGPL